MGFFLLLFIILCLFVSIRLFLYRTTLVYRLKKWGHWVEDRVHVHQSLKVPELDENNQENIFYRKVYTYLTSLPIEDSDNTNLISGNKPNGVVLRLDDNQTVLDTFLGARVSWTNRVENCKKTFVLKMKKKDKRRILQSYIQHIYRAAEDVESRGSKELKLYMNTTSLVDDNRRWSSVRLTHPATFETIAMDSDLKKKVKSDLDSFLKSKQYYHRLGRVWKRSYLLYGPSGTGKSSFIAAMAKYLSYDVYEIDLTKVVDDSDLKKLLLQTTRKSLIVVEDLDRFLTSNSTSTAVRLTLTGVLNFMDGLLNSCCGDEKLMIFTVNSKDKIDSSILRPGRIDVHIYFPMCTFNSFKTLANNCLGIKEHKLFPQVEEILQTGSTISPAEMSELMISNRGSPGRALKSVITALQINGEARMSSSTVEDTSSPAESSNVFVMDGNCSVPVVKEIQKLYGLLRLKSSKKIGPSDQDSGSVERSR
ncbi:putative AAA+ ATPase domain, ATPase, AAA-type, core, AAA-type ATPase domain-containing protein [Helianthus annuus]|nr:putative AAA+ ATPase domain, ATPase, AAA-type, core, AAA-type ATPase domain-containing protein [Helianthus annuus]